MKVKSIEITAAANATPEVIRAWKEANPRGIWEITVFNGEEQKTGYVRKPSRKELGAAMTLKNDPLLQAEDILRSCCLGGDTELLEDDDYFQGAVAQFSELMEVRQGEIKKL